MDTVNGDGSKNAKIIKRHYYRISSNRSRALNTSRTSNTGRGSGIIVLIEAGGFYSRKYGNGNTDIFLNQVIWFYLNNTIFAP